MNSLKAHYRSVVSALLNQASNDTSITPPPPDTSAVLLTTPPSPKSRDTVIDDRVHFMHIRLHDPKAVNPQNQLGIAGHGGATIAYRRSPDLKTFAYSYCVCRLNENFRRSLGRQIAHNYFNRGDSYVITANPDVNTEFYLHNIAKPAAIDKLERKNPGLKLAFVGRRINKNKVVC